jgi:hypothetical protein
MEDFERQLENALRRREPPPWLESKIMATVNRPLAPEPKPALWARLSAGFRLRWVSAGLAACLVVSGVVWQRERAEQDRVAGEQAKAKLEVALKVTSSKLRKIQMIVNAMEQDN